MIDSIDASGGSCSERTRRCLDYPKMTLAEPRDHLRESLERKYR
jgi:hypothetical protein